VVSHAPECSDDGGAYADEGVHGKDVAEHARGKENLVGTCATALLLLLNEYSVLRTQVGAGARETMPERCVAGL
jgi:hypothetical protein